MSETKKLSFFVPGEPQGKGRPRFSTRSGAVRTYTPEKTVVYEAEIRLAYAVANKKPDALSDRPVVMHITAVYSIPKRATKAQRAGMERGDIKPVKKPDADNIIKAVADALNGLAYKDDAQIIDARCVKLYGPEPGLEVTIWEV